MSVESRLKTLEELMGGLQGRRLANADMLQDRRVASTAPSGNDRLIWDSTNKAWKPQTPTRQVFIPPSDLNNAVGNYAVHQIGPGETTATTIFNWHVPTDWASFTSINIVTIPDATEDLQADLDVSKAAAGTQHTTDDDQSLNETKGVTAGEVEEWDISGIGTLFTTVAAGDYLGIKVKSDKDIMRVIGLMIVYTV